MGKESPFENDWYESLREHYMHVIRNHDKVTEKSLITVMHDVGFDDRELAELRVRATMRAEDMPDGFVPDLKALEAEEPTVYAIGFEAPQEVLPPVEEIVVVDEVLEIEVEAEPVETMSDEIETQEEVIEDEIAPEEPPKDDPQQPKQLSMF